MFTQSFWSICESIGVLREVLFQRSLDNPYLAPEYNDTKKQIKNFVLFRKNYQNCYLFSFAQFIMRQQKHLNTINCN